MRCEIHVNNNNNDGLILPAKDSSQVWSPKRGGGTSRIGISTHKIDMIAKVWKQSPECIEVWEE